MKKYDLSISLPAVRGLEQEMALDRILSDERLLSYSITLVRAGKTVTTEHYQISFYI